MCDGFRETLVINPQQRILLQFRPAEHDCEALSDATANAEKSSLIGRWRPSPRPQRLPIERPIPKPLDYPTEEIYLQFTRTQFPIAGPLAHLISQRGFTQYSSPLLRQCVLSLSMTFFGVHHDEARILHEGLRHYGRALKCLGDALGDADMKKSDDVLLSISTAFLFECFMPTCRRGRAWINHVLGLERLFELRGPPPNRALGSHQTIEAAVLERMRPSMILGALIKSRPSLFAQTKWKIPLVSPCTYDAKSTLDNLLNVLAECARLRFEKEEILTSQSSEASRLHSSTLTLRRTWKLLLKIRDWLRQRTALHPEDCVEFMPPSPPSETSWSTVYDFASPDAANAHSLHFTVALHLLENLQSLHHYSLNENFSSTLPCEMTTLAIDQQIRESAVEICRTFHYHLSHRTFLATPVFVGFPMRVAWQALSNGRDPDTIWLESALGKLRPVLKPGVWSSMSSFINPGR